MNNLDGLLCGFGVPNCGPPPVVITTVGGVAAA